MRHIITLLMILGSIESFSQFRIYKGHIDKYPIQLITYSESGEQTSAFYSYDKYNTPIYINGTQRNDSLILIEKNAEGESILEFIDYNPEDNEIRGKWISQDKQTLFDINLTKQHEFDSYDKSAFEKLEFMQPESTADNYFCLLLSKNEGDDIQVVGVRIYEKKTDRLIQELDLECQFRGLSNLSVDDYNFDGVDDISIFEASYSGPNTTEVYILRNSKSDEYFISEISGTSLEFDSESQLIYEHNQCCAGRRHMNSVYRLVDNKMVLLEQECIEFDDKTGDFIEIDCD